MAVNNGVITSISDFSEVGNVLQTSCLTTDNLCTHRNINIWAKYKPFRNATKFFKQDTDSTKTDRNAAIKAANCGLQVPPARSSATILSCFDDVWTYLPPTGGESSPYRISDFLNYSHRDTPPIEAVGDIEHNVFWDGKPDFTFGKKNGINTGYGVTLSDFGQFTDYPRLGLVFNGVLNNGDKATYIYVFDSMPQIVTLAYNLVNAINFKINTAIRYGLFATNHDATSGFTADIATSRWYSLPNDGVKAKIAGTLTFTNDFHINYKVVACRYATSGSWITNSREIFYGNTSDKEEGNTGDGSQLSLKAYYKPQSQYDYTASLRFELVNTGKTVTFKKANISIYCTGNLSITENTPSRDPMVMYDANDNSVDEITLPAYSTTTIGLRLPQYLFTMDSKGVHQSIAVTDRNTRMSTEIKVMYAGVLNPVFSIPVRITSN